MNERKRRDELGKWIEEQIEGMETVNASDLSNEAVDHFQKDEAFVRGLLAETLRPVVHVMVLQKLAQTRNERVIEMGDEVVTHTEFKRRSGKFKNRFARWMEHAGDKHINFMRMFPADLRKAAAERKARAGAELEIANFELAIQEPMDEGERVEDRYTPEELEEIWTRMKEEVLV